MKKTFLETKIDETFEVAILLGLSNANDMQKMIFKNLLKGIAVAAIDEVKATMNTEMFKLSQTIQE